MKIKLLSLKKKVILRILDIDSEGIFFITQTTEHDFSILIIFRHLRVPNREKYVCRRRTFLETFIFGLYNSIK